MRPLALTIQRQLLKQLRRLLAGRSGLRSKDGVRLALEILEANGISEISVRDAFGFNVRLLTCDHSIAPNIIRHGQYSFALMQQFADILQARGIDIASTLFVNIGANIGTSCINAYQIGFRRFIAVEPEVANFGLLRQNLAQLSGADVRYENVAVGCREEIATLYKNPSNTGGHSLMPSRGRAARPAEHVMVPVRTLDMIVEGTEPFVLLADVEGYEPQVLRGGRDFILKQCLAMCLELTPSRYSREEGQYLIEYLSSFSASFLDLLTGDVKPIAMLSHTMEMRQRKHFDIILVNTALGGNVTCSRSGGLRLSAD